MYEVCLESIHPHTMKNRHLFKKIQDTRNIVHRIIHLSPLQSRHLGTSHSSPSVSSTVQKLCKTLCGNRHQLPRLIFLNLIENLKSLPSQR